MVFKSLNELAPQYLISLFNRNSQCSTRCLRNTETDLRVPKKTTANGQKCFSLWGAKLWNSLSADSKLASSQIASKSLLSDYCRGGACGGGAGCPWVVGWLEANGGHGFDRCTLCVFLSPGAAGASAVGSAPVLDCGFVFSFFFRIFISCMYICI